MKANHIILGLLFFFISGKIYSQADADFYFEITGNDFLTLNLYDYSSASETILSRNWDFGDGNSENGNNTTPVHTYSEQGIYPVKLEITTANFSDTVTYYISMGDNYYQGDSCLAAFSYQQFGNDGLGFNFFNDSYIPAEHTDSYFWSFGDGTSSEEKNPSHIFASEGEYEVSLTISSGNCNDTHTSYIYAGANNWYPDECQALFWFNPEQENYRKIHFYDFSYGNEEILYRYWEFGDGNISTQANPVHEFSEDGTYQTSLKIVTENCESTFPVDIIVQDNNQNGDTLMPLFYPEVINGTEVKFHNLTIGNPTSYLWDFGDGNTSYEFEPLYSFDGHGVHRVALSVSSGVLKSKETITNTIVIEFSTSEGKSAKEINKAFYYPGGYTNVENIKSLSFSVFPNPSDDYLTVKSKNKNICIQIFDITGKLRIEEKTKSKINIKNLPAGLYLIKVTDKDISGTVKFIKN